MKYKEAADILTKFIKAGKKDILRIIEEKAYNDLVARGYSKEKISGMLSDEVTRLARDLDNKMSLAIHELYGKNSSIESIRDYFAAKRDQIEILDINEDGEIVVTSLEGDIQFDPSGKTNVDDNNKFDTGENVPDIKFGDEKTKEESKKEEKDMNDDISILRYGDVAYVDFEKQEEPDVVFGDEKSKKEDKKIDPKDVMYGDEYSNPERNVEVVKPGEKKETKEVNADNIKFGDEKIKEEPKEEKPNDDVSVLYYGDIAYVDFEKQQEPDVKFGDEDKKDDDNLGGPDAGGFGGPKFGGF